MLCLRALTSHLPASPPQPNPRPHLHPPQVLTRNLQFRQFQAPKLPPWPLAASGLSSSRTSVCLASLKPRSASHRVCVSFLSFSFCVCTGLVFCLCCVGASALFSWRSLESLFHRLFSCSAHCEKGDVANPRYDAVCTGRTGHTEVVSCSMQVRPLFSPPSVCLAVFVRDRTGTHTHIHTHSSVSVSSLRRCRSSTIHPRSATSRCWISSGRSTTPPRSTDRATTSVSGKFGHFDGFR